MVCGAPGLDGSRVCFHVFLSPTFHPVGTDDGTGVDRTIKK